jgi:hypothetical protein
MTLGVAALAGAVGLATLLVPARALARDDDVDGRMPIRIGWGWAAAYPAPALSVAFDSELGARLSPRVGVFLSTGFEGVVVYDPRAPDRARGFFTVGLGGGLFLRSPEVGPAIALSAPISLDFRNDAVVGVGLGLRATLYPYYHSITEAIACTHGPLGSYVASSLFLWTGVRFDATDESKGAVVAFGAGIDVARAMLLPLMGWIFRQGCSKERQGSAWID